MNDPAASQMFGVAGRTILVVGGTRGIGRGIALRLAAGGADVIANYARNDEAAAATADAVLATGGLLTTVRADVSADAGRERLVATVTTRWPRLDAIVYAAATGVHRPAVELTGRHFDFTFGLNVRAFLLLVRALAPAMPAGGAVVALSSEGAVHAMTQYALTGASKAALESLCRHLAVELAPAGIRVNVLSPGTVRTDAWEALPDAERRLAAAAAVSPRGKLTSIDEVAWAAQFLLSDAAAGLAGHTLVVDGGTRLRGAG
jgi:enoyl-[acyl-carrier protein] reductase III